MFQQTRLNLAFIQICNNSKCCRKDNNISFSADCEMTGWVFRLLLLLGAAALCCACVCVCVCWTIPEVEDRLIPRSQFCHLAWVFTWDRILAAALHGIATDWLSVMTTQPNTFSLFLHFCNILSRVPCLSEMTKSIFSHVQKTKTCSKMSNVSV